MVYITLGRASYKAFGYNDTMTMCLVSLSAKETSSMCTKVKDIV